MFNRYTYQSILKIEGFNVERNFYEDQTNGNCFLQVTTGDNEHYRSCGICHAKLRLISEKMSEVREFELIEASFRDKGSNGIYVKFNVGPSTSPIVFLREILQRDITRVERLEDAKGPFAYSAPLYWKG